MGAAPDTRLAALNSLPLSKPSAEERRTLANLLKEAINANNDNLKSACGKIGISENTLRCVRRAETVREWTWSKTRNYVRDKLSEP